MTEDFNIFVPLDIIEKGEKDKDGLPEELLISGIASTSKYGKDKDGQILDPNGFDFSPLLSTGFFNMEHSYIKTKDPSMIIGEPTNAFVKNNDFYIEGKLYKENPKAVALYKLGQTLKKAGSSRKIGYSIEGSIVEKDPLNPNYIKKSIISHCAVTLSPKCEGTQMLIKAGDSYETQKDSDFLVDITDEDGTRWTVDQNLNIEKGGEGSRGGKIVGHTKSGKAIYDSIDKKHTSKYTSEDHDDAAAHHREEKKKLYADRNLDPNQRKKFTHHQTNENFHEIESGNKKFHSEHNVKKAMVAGSITGTDTTDQNLTQQPLKEESVEGGKKKKKDYKKLLKQLAERRGDMSITKAEAFTFLVNEFNMDGESCDRVFLLAEKIEKRS